MSASDLKCDMRMCMTMLDFLRLETEKYEDRLKNARNELQSICQHNYECVLEDDGHRTVRWYVCSECERATRMKSETLNTHR